MAPENPAVAHVRERAATEVARFFDYHARMVLALCRTHLRDPRDAEDAAQQTFLSAYRALLGGTRPRDAAAWLATIARNECRGRIARRLSQPEPLPLLAEALEAPPGGEPLEAVDVAAQMAGLRSALGDLPERQREAVVLRDVYGLSYDEVAAAMSVSEAAVDSLLSRARRRLEQRVRPLRVAQGVLVVPASLRETLSNQIDGMPPPEATATAATSAGLLAKLWAVPAWAKLAGGAAALGVAVGTPLAIAQIGGGAASAEAPVAAAQHEPVRVPPDARTAAPPARAPATAPSRRHRPRPRKSAPQVAVPRRAAAPTPTPSVSAPALSESSTAGLPPPPAQVDHGHTVIVSTTAHEAPRSSAGPPKTRPPRPSRSGKAPTRERGGPDTSSRPDPHAESPATSADESDPRGGNSGPGSEEAFAPSSDHSGSEDSGSGSDDSGSGSDDSDGGSEGGHGSDESQELDQTES